jgi:hypothetical protein
MIKRRRGVIPRKTVQGRHVQDTVDNFGRPLVGQAVYTPFNLLNTTVQPYQGEDLMVLDTGFQSKRAFTLFTETKVTEGEEDSQIKPDEVMIDGDWYRVVKVKPWQVGVIPHYEVIVVKTVGNLI